MSEPTVTTGSTNTYSDRAAVETQYGTDPALKASRFWYHAELIENARLRRLLSGELPDLVKVLDTPPLKDKDPALLCYYFFFPAREEALAAPCTNIEAKEFGSCAGEWACLALLLERDAPDKNYHPTFIGQTGRMLAPITGVSLPPQADDENDAAKRIVMKVNKFSDASLIEGHPKLFVANGTHSIYLQTGTIAVAYPPDSFPRSCGMVEIPPQPVSHTSQHGGLTFYSKLFLAVQLSRLWGLALSIVLIILEGAKPYGGLDVVGGVDPGAAAAPDETALPGRGKFVRPRNVQPQNVVGVGTEVGSWQSAVVERATQVWWPGDSPASGYRGRWGPRVANDPFGRRAGMRFPAFWRIFFLSFAKGKATGTL